MFLHDLRVGIALKLSPVGYKREAGRETIIDVRGVFLVNNSQVFLSPKSDLN